jgi:hypothetical protein
MDTQRESYESNGKETSLTRVRKLIRSRKTTRKRGISGDQYLPGVETAKNPPYTIAELDAEPLSIENKDRASGGAACRLAHPARSGYLHDQT